MTGAFAFIALMVSLWALGAAQAAWRRSAPKVAQQPLQSRGDAFLKELGFVEVAHIKAGQHQPPKAKLPSISEERPSREAIIEEMTGVKTNPIATGEAFRCNSCREIRKQPPNFITQVELEMPFLDSTLPIHVQLCEGCIGGS